MLYIGNPAVLVGSLSSVFLAVLFTLYAYGICLAFLCSFFNDSIISLASSGEDIS